MKWYVVNYIFAAINLGFYLNLGNPASLVALIVCGLTAVIQDWYNV